MEKLAGVGSAFNKLPKSPTPVNLLAFGVQLPEEPTNLLADLLVLPLLVPVEEPEVLVALRP